MTNIIQNYNVDRNKNNRLDLFTMKKNDEIKEKKFKAIVKDLCFQVRSIQVCPSRNPSPVSTI